MSHNQLTSIQELFKISQPQKLECLAIAGNYFVEREPNFKQNLLTHFANLKELDCLQFNNPRNAMKDCKSLKQNLIPFLLKLEALATRLGGGTDDKEYAELLEVLDTVPMSKAQKQSVTQLYQVIEQIREKLLAKTHKNSLLKDLEQPTAREVF